MDYAPDEPDEGMGEEIRRIFHVLFANLHVVGLVTLLTLALVIAYVWLASVLYTSKVEILIDPRRRLTVESEVTPTGLGSSAAGADTLLLESQVEILRSRNVLDTLIRVEQLDKDPEFIGTDAPEWVERLKSAVKAVVYGPQSDLWRSASPYDEAVRTLGKRLEVERQRNTYVIGISVKSRDPKKAARLANSIADIYVRDANDAGAKSTREAATVLDSKLGELRAAVNKSAAAVEAYKQSNNLIGTNKTLVVEQQLSDLNRELARARLDVQEALARRNQLRAVVAEGVSPELRLPDLGQSDVVSDLQARLARAESALAELELTYADRHPALKRSRRAQGGAPGVARPGVQARPRPARRGLQDGAGEVGLAGGGGQAAGGADGLVQCRQRPAARAGARGRLGAHRLRELPAPRQGGPRADRHPAQHRAGHILGLSRIAAQRPAGPAAAGKRPGARPGAGRDRRLPVRRGLRATTARRGRAAPGRGAVVMSGCDARRDAGRDAGRGTGRDAGPDTGPAPQGPRPLVVSGARALSGSGGPGGLDGHGGSHDRGAGSRAARASRPTPLVRALRALAAIMPGAIISYSALVDPLINFDLASGVHFGGIEIERRKARRGSWPGSSCPPS